MLESNGPPFVQVLMLRVLETKRVNEKLIQNVCLESIHLKIQGM